MGRRWSEITLPVSVDIPGKGCPDIAVGALTSGVCARWPDVPGICLSGPPQAGVVKGRRRRGRTRPTGRPTLYEPGGALCASHDCLGQPPCGWPTCAFGLIPEKGVPAPFSEKLYRSGDLFENHQRGTPSSAQSQESPGQAHVRREGVPGPAFVAVWPARMAAQCRTVPHSAAQCRAVPRSAGPVPRQHMAAGGLRQDELGKC
jgi:hypothetical protein